MKRILILAAILGGLLFSVPAFATSDDQTLTAVAVQTNADTTSVAFPIPNPNQTILIKQITVFYDNAANTNPIYVGINDATAAFTRRLWLGQAMVSSGIQTIQYVGLDQKIDAATAQLGIRVFLSAASSDSIMAIVSYELIPR